MLTRVTAISCLLVLVLVGLTPTAAWADQDLVTFAENAYAETEYEQHHHTCAVCGSQLFRSRQLLEILDGRYQFNDVEQAYCPVCQVTTLSLQHTPRAARFFRLLSWRLPAARDKVVYQDNRYAMAFKSSAALPFISNIFGLRTENGQIYFEVE